MVRKPIDEANRILQEAGSGNTSEAAKARHAAESKSSPPQKRDTKAENARSTVGQVAAKAQRNERLKILVKIIAGRFIEVYCDSELVDCLVINEPDVSTVNGLSAEQLLEKVLPKVYADIHCQNLKVAVGEAQHLTAADVSERVAKLELFDAMALSRAKQDRMTNLEMLRAAMGAAR
jgi:hypothetical protein